jgi:predicted phosphoadenosine phosphosulfate sulfurtransferase
MEENAWFLRNEVEEAAKNQRLALAWSGGKDSIVLQHILQGIDFVEIQQVSNPTYPIHFPDSARWLYANTPEKTKIFDMGFDRQKIIEIAFPKNSLEMKSWLQPKWRVFKNRQKEISLDWTLFGRRTDDGNKIMREKHRNGQGMKTWCPLMDWSNEEIAAYISHFGVRLPPDYGFYNGFRYGLRTWPLTNMRTIKDRYPELIGVEITNQGIFL